MKKYELHHGDSIEVMRAMPDNSVDAIVTDPPYELGFMGKKWDASGIANSVELWTEALRVLKPGGHLLAFSGSRTCRRMTCAIEDAGFDVRDQIMWIYGSGFPKSLDVSKAIDKAAGVERDKVRIDASEVRNPKANGGGRDGMVGATRPWIEQAMERGFHEKDSETPATDAARQWQGWGTALKPAHEPICVARKPLIGTVAANVLTHGTGALNIDGCRVGTEILAAHQSGKNAMMGGLSGNENNGGAITPEREGRWPANLIHDGSREVWSRFPIDGDASASRFFYGAKASKQDRDEGCEALDLKRKAKLGGSDNDRQDLDPVSERFRTAPSRNNHPTVKPTDLMRYLCRLVTPPGGVVLDIFMGSGSTGKAAILEGFRFVGIDLMADHVQIAEARIRHAEVMRGDEPTPANDNGAHPDLFAAAGL